MANFPAELKYTKEHEWVKMEGDVATIGITDFAQSELGDIVFIDVDTVGQSLNSGDVFGTIEAVKTVSDLYMPVSGEILEVNSVLNDNPEAVNEDPYMKGWIIKVRVTDSGDELMSADKYQSLVG